MPRLCVFGCSPSGVPMHRFPNVNKLPDLFKSWVTLVGGKLESPSDYEYYQKKRVCDIHFIDKDRNRNNRINAEAIPSLHLPGSTSSQTVSEQPLTHFHQDDILLAEEQQSNTCGVSNSTSEQTFNQPEVTDNYHQSSLDMFEHPYHQFPHPVKNPDRFKAWVHIVGGKLDSPADYELYRKKVICDIHFTDKDRNRNNRLNFLAVPSLYLPVLDIPFIEEDYRLYIITLRPIGAEQTKLRGLVDPRNFVGNVMHAFPNPDKFPERFRAWVDLVGSNLQQLTDYDIYKKRICDIHFTDVHRNRFKRLNALAMPTLYLPEIIKLDEALSDENSVPEVLIATTSDMTKTDPENGKNTHSNLAAYWKSATREVQHDDQAGSYHPGLSDAADDAGSSDDYNIQEPPPPPQLNLNTAQMCRVCLALNVKMFDLRDIELKTMFQMTTGITFEENKGSKLGSFICWECAARLKAASTFIRKALFSESLLQGLIKKGEQIQKQYFETVKEEADSLIPPKTLTVTEIVHIVEIEDQNYMTQLVQSGDDDEPLVSENDETEEIMTFEIKEQIIDENSKMDVEGDKDFPIETGIDDDPKCSYAEDQNITKILKKYPLDSTSSIEETINSGYSHPLLDKGHTSLRSDSTYPLEDCDEKMSKTFLKTYTKSKILPKQNTEFKNPIKRAQIALSHDHIYHKRRQK